MFQLMVLEKGNNTTTLASNIAVLVGRDQSCHLQLHDPSASRVHCRIIEHDGRVRLYDAGSRWGTFVNGQRVTERNLQIGDRIQIGATILQLLMESNDDIENRKATSASVSGRPF